MRLLPNSRHLALTGYMWWHHGRARQGNAEANPIIQIATLLKAESYFKHWWKGKRESLHLGCLESLCHGVMFSRAFVF